jgi:hypothetical protein
MNGGFTEKPRMYRVRSLTIRNSPRFLSLATFPSLIHLKLLSDSINNRSRLSSRDIPPHIETLKAENIEFEFEDPNASRLISNIRLFEGVNILINWRIDGAFSLSRVRSLHLEEVHVRNERGRESPLDIPSTLCNHEALETIDSLYLIEMIITPEAIDTIQMLKGISRLTIESCYFESDALSILHQMLISHSRESTFPHLRFLRLSGFQPLLQPKPEHPYDEYEKIDFKQIIADTISTTSPLRIEVGALKHWPLRYFWEAYRYGW